MHRSVFLGYAIALVAMTSAVFARVSEAVIIATERIWSLIPVLVSPRTEVVRTFEPVEQAGAALARTRSFVARRVDRDPEKRGHAPLQFGSAAFA